MILSQLFGRKKKTVLIMQCRLSSTRLPGKALLQLGDKNVLEHALNAMKKVKADKYYLATDHGSAAELEPIAKNMGWNFFKGSLEDVLDRYCCAIEESGADVVIRATADNPFLFYEAANALRDEYFSRLESDPVDYITFNGLPHGSGIEIFNAHSLLKARTETESPYDHEHVGPALYNHKDKYKCVFLKAPHEFHGAEYRTTIDTPQDYRRANAMISFLGVQKEPYSAQQVFSALKDDNVKFPVLLLPSTQKGQGTGHLYRCLEIACQCGCDVYIPENATLPQTKALVTRAKENGLKDYQIVTNLDRAGDYCLCVTDMFVIPKEISDAISSVCPVCSMDEGNPETNYADYLLDIIPSVGIKRQANYTERKFIASPENVRTYPDHIETALVVFGGEDPKSLAVPCAIALAGNGVKVTAVVSDASVQNMIPDKLKENISLVPPIENLRDKLFEYDLVLTHYGLTAFESLKAGCAVILMAITPLHRTLAQKYGFTVVEKDNIDAKLFAPYIQLPSSIKKDSVFESGSGYSESLASFIRRLSKGRQLPCPVCRISVSPDAPEKDPVSFRVKDRTFRCCRNCGMNYISFSALSEETDYSHDYFYSDYQKQYGKTYLEDFAFIKSQCVRRVSNIDSLYHHSHGNVTPAVLDIGCAMGPFLDAANDSGWQVFGTDISREAVEYVNHTLNYPAAVASFPDLDVTKEFGMSKFDAVTMWYVIEHFKDLDSVLHSVSNLVKKGGIFAFSTPNAKGVTGKFNRAKFFEQSPADHYSLWDPETCSRILMKYGFKVVKIVPTGIHPERFPYAQKHNVKEGSFMWRMLSHISWIKKLGDTFEVYCKKI